jgi:hypothetical protein
LSYTGCGIGITGSGNLITEQRNFSDFTNVEAHNGFQLELSQANTFSIEITADDNLWEYLEVTKSGDTLKIKLDSGRFYHSADLRAKISMPELKALDLSGGSQAIITNFSSSHDFSINLSGGSRVVGDITADDANFDLSGGSRVNLEGTADFLEVHGSGGSHLDLENFSVDNADIHLSGGGSATVNVDGTLDAHLSGGSNVTYAGNPSLGDIDLSGGSEVRKK